MKHLAQIVALGDSILKGIQVDPETKRYVTRNEIGIPALERDFDLTVRNDSHFGASAVKGERLLDRMLERGLACDGVVMDFGGNDCDFKWAEIAADPAADHPPAVPATAISAPTRSSTPGRWSGWPGRRTCRWWTSGGLPGPLAPGHPAVRGRDPSQLRRPGPHRPGLPGLRGAVGSGPGDRLRTEKTDVLSGTSVFHYHLSVQPMLSAPAMKGSGKVSLSAISARMAAERSGTVSGP